MPIPLFTIRSPSGYSFSTENRIPVRLSIPPKGPSWRTLPWAAPEQAVADGNGIIYDNLEDKSEVVAIDSRTLKITARWPVAPAGQPVAIAMDREHRRLFIAGRNPQLLVVMDADNGKIIGQPFPIGSRVDSNVYDPATGLLASSTGEGTIHIFHQDAPDKLRAVETVKTEFGAKTMALDPKTDNLLVDTTKLLLLPPPPRRSKIRSPGLRRARFTC